MPPLASDVQPQEAAIQTLRGVAASVSQVWCGGVPTCDMVCEWLHMAGCGSFLL